MKNTHISYIFNVGFGMAVLLVGLMLGHALNIFTEESTRWTMLAISIIGLLCGLALIWFYTRPQHKMPTINSEPAGIRDTEAITEEGSAATQPVQLPKKSDNAIFVWFKKISKKIKDKMTTSWTVFWKKNAEKKTISIVVSVLCLIILGLEVWGTYGSPKKGFCYWWMFITLVCFSFVGAAIWFTNVRERLVYTAIQLRKNNNWRAGAFMIATVVFVISAILAGPGEPLLFSTVPKVTAPVIDYVQKPSVMERLNALWYGTESREYQAIYGVSEEDALKTVAQMTVGSSKESKSKPESSTCKLVSCFLRCYTLPVDLSLLRTLV